jgi:pimeloyl-ACP methyl ester carboxylesterase
MEHILPRGIIQSSLRNVYGDPGKVSTELVDRYYDLTLREGNRGAVAKRFESIKVVNEERVQALKLPTLILWGAKDNLIPVENGARFAKDIAGSKLVVFPELGHVPQEEDPVSTVRVVQEFLGIE